MIFTFGGGLSFSSITRKSAKSINWLLFTYFLDAAELLKYSHSLFASVLIFSKPTGSS
jgi:hypothetical protein